MNVTLYDCTLREGAQSAGAAFSVEDKITVVRMLDKLGVQYIEAGNPGSNPKDAMLYQQLSSMTLENAKIVAFGATCRVGIKPQDDPNIKALLSAETPAICIFGKSWDFHVKEILRATLEQNLEIIADTVSYFKSLGKEVIFDAEHFFDGYKNNPEYAIESLKVAKNAGADWICLCDTNGGCFPHEIEGMVKKAVEICGDRVGMHCHNDTGMAVGNTIAGVVNGVTMAQVTVNGYGERCGNADLCTVLANLQIKLGYTCVPDENVKDITMLSRTFAELLNFAHPANAPYVGRNAFTHKAGMHIDAVTKNPLSFEHVPPSSVGNERIFLLSEVAGRKAVLQKLAAFAPDIDKDSPLLVGILDRLKELEYKGYQFEAAGASFELMVRRLLGTHKPYFELKGFKVIIANPVLNEGEDATAMIEIIVNGETEITAAVGNGPVNALDRALRKALERFYPVLSGVHLVDFKVRVIDSTDATASSVRVLIESTDGTEIWNTVGVSTDIINASWLALVDSLEYKLMKQSV